MKIFPILLVMFCPVSMLGQDLPEGFTYRYFLEDYNCRFNAGTHDLNDTIDFGGNDLTWPVEGIGEVRMKIYFKSLLGACSVEVLDLNNNLIAKGEYMESLAMLCKYDRWYDYIGHSWHITPSRYYQPLKEGLWIERNVEGIMETKRYHLGFLLE